MWLQNRIKKKVLDFRRQEEFRVSKSPACSLLSLIKISQICHSFFSTFPHPFSQSLVAQAGLAVGRQAKKVQCGSWRRYITPLPSPSFAPQASFLLHLCDYQSSPHTCAHTHTRARTPTASHLSLLGLHICEFLCPVGVKWDWITEVQRDRYGGADGQIRRDRWRDEELLLSCLRKLF